MLPIKQAMKRLFTMPPQITCANAVCANAALPQFNQLLIDLLNLFDSQLVLTLLYDSLNLVINAFISGLLGGMAQDKRSRERCRSWTVLPAQYTSALSSGFPILQCYAQALNG